MSHSKITLYVFASLAVLAGSAQARRLSVQADFDGDAKADLSVYNADAGAWYIHQSSNSTLQQRVWGWDQARPVLGDFDGDGKADLAVFNTESGVWFILQSSNGQLRQQTFGYPEGRPVPADFDGDGKTDLAVYQRSSGDWFIYQSSNGQLRHQNFGWIEGRPVPADFDGDGKADLAVYHRATGNWYIQSSIDGSVTIFNWGWSQARPVPADYDGDGKTDLAVYNRYAGDWYVLQSSNSTLRLQNWGWVKAGAIPSYRDGGIQGLIILAFGDSITFGTSSESNGPETGYPILLEHKAEPALGGHFVTINGGEAGEQTSEGVLRIGAWLTYFKPDLTLVMEGTNDEFFKVPYSTTEANLRSMIAQAKVAGSAAIIGTIPPVIKTSTHDRTQQEKLIEGFNPRIYNIGSSMGIQVAKVWEAITAVPNWQNTLMDQETANHPNDAGYLVVRDAFFAPVEAGTLSGEFY